MKTSTLVSVLVLACSLCGSSVALADRGHRHHRSHGHVGIGLFLGSPLFYPPYYPSPFYYPYYPYAPPPVVVTPAEPPVYIEQSPGASTAQQDDYWYYCDKPEGYYPYVPECAGGWRRVEPQPPDR